MKTIVALIVILLASWELEILGGIQIITLSWNFPLVGGSLAAIVAQTGNIVLSYWHTYPIVLSNPPHYWTAAGVTDALVTFYLWLHPVWAVFSLFWPKYAPEAGSQEAERARGTAAKDGLRLPDAGEP